jgi:hypothetical protein
MRVELYVCTIAHISKTSDAIHAKINRTCVFTVTNILQKEKFIWVFFWKSYPEPNIIYRKQERIAQNCVYFQNC